jgi:ketosteroid isomerase-like protein
MATPPAASTDSPARAVALAYFDAWSNGDLDRAMAYIAPDIVCDAPAGRIEGAEAYREFMEPFVRMLVSARMIAAFGDADTALVMYDTHTALVPSAPGAECVTVEQSLIRYSRFLFDRLPFDAARRAGT